ncbi:MAG: hypothetical protein H6742_06360 [Alphaproteobacteria bacterium]|nr:hypothetical protein [Alphaproteobacteria bacterium]
MSLLLLGCTADPGRQRIEPTTIEVTVQGELGSPEEPLPFSPDTLTRTVEVQTLDIHGEPYPFDGDLVVRVRPGKLDQQQWVSVVDGVGTFDVAFHAAFGPTRIWVADEGDKDQDSGRVPGFATGVTDAIHYAFPTIREMNEIDDHETNHLSGEFAELRVSDRNVVVTQLGTNGFWVTDIDDEPGSWNSLYVYSFSKPDGIVEGSRLTILTGNTQEYLATTQISFPVYEPDEGVTLTLPEPVDLDTVDTCDNDVMEGLESGLVQAHDLTIPSDFGPGSEDYADYLDYGQWPLELSGTGCRIYADSNTIPGFYPPDHAGESVDEITGLLKEIWGKWIVTARGEGDIVGEGFEEDRSTGVVRPHREVEPLLPLHALPRPKPGTPEANQAAAARAARHPDLPSLPDACGH